MHDVMGKVTEMASTVPFIRTTFYIKRIGILTSAMADCKRTGVTPARRPDNLLGQQQQGARAVDRHLGAADADLEARLPAVQGGDNLGGFHFAPRHL
ncbi:MAG: hypothetical protein NTU88_12515 [Armatimonadetes bacterium]|nr:hypothetical protein [Armatimonadota bacterium]